MKKARKRIGGAMCISLRSKRPAHQARGFCSSLAIGFLTPALSNFIFPPAFLKATSFAKCFKLLNVINSALE